MADKYVYQEYPRVMYRPDGTSATFHSAEEIPETEDWYASQAEAYAANVPEELRDDGGDDDEHEVALTAEDLAQAFSQQELIAHIEAANETREEEIEFGGNWPKVKLAQVLIDAGIELTIDEEE